MLYYMAQYVSKEWLVTINCPKELQDDDEKAGEWLSEWYDKIVEGELPGLVYAVVKGEQGAKTGNQHLHAYLLFDHEINKCELVGGYRNKAEPLLPVAQCEKVKATDIAINYVKCDGPGCCRSFSGKKDHGEDCDCKCVWYFDVAEFGERVARDDARERDRTRSEGVRVRRPELSNRERTVDKDRAIAYGKSRIDDMFADPEWVAKLMQEEKKTA